MIADDKKIFFYDFDEWSKITQFPIQQFLNTNELTSYYTRKINQILSHHENKNHVKIQCFYFFSLLPNIKQYSISFIQNTFKLQYIQTQIPLNIQKLSEEWYGLIGTAFRGLIPRAKDTIISMMAIGTEEEYQQTKLFRFVYMWARFISILFLSIALVFFLLNNYVFQKLSKPVKITQTTQQTKLSQDKDMLEEQLDLFNYYVPRLINVYKDKPKYNEYFSDIYLLSSQNNIEILEIYYSGNITTITVQGKSTSKKSITNFKKDLDNLENFKYVSSPVESLSNENGKYFFTIKLGYGKDAVPISDSQTNQSSTTINQSTTTKEKETTILTLPE